MRYPRGIVYASLIKRYAFLKRNNTKSILMLVLSGSCSNCSIYFSTSVSIFFIVFSIYLSPLISISITIVARTTAQQIIATVLCSAINTLFNVTLSMMKNFTTANTTITMINFSNFWNIVKSPFLNN